MFPNLLQLFFILRFVDSFLKTRFLSDGLSIVKSSIEKFCYYLVIRTSCIWSSLEMIMRIFEQDSEINNFFIRKRNISLSKDSIFPSFLIRFTTSYIFCSLSSKFCSLSSFCFPQREHSISRACFNM